MHQIPKEGSLVSWNIGKLIRKDEKNYDNQSGVDKDRTGNTYHKKVRQKTTSLVLVSIRLLSGKVK